MGNRRMFIAKDVGQRKREMVDETRRLMRILLLSVKTKLLVPKEKNEGLMSTELESYRLKRIEGTEEQLEVTKLQDNKSLVESYLIIEKEQKFLHGHNFAQKKILVQQRAEAIRNKTSTTRNLNMYQGGIDKKMFWWESKEEEESTEKRKLDSRDEHYWFEWPDFMMRLTEAGLEYSELDATWFFMSTYLSDETGLVEFIFEESEKTVYALEP
ncbi:hypothetical protein Tco_0459679 [Tanacetum coccineum]